MAKQTKTKSILKALDDLANISKLDTSLNPNVGVEHGESESGNSGETDQAVIEALAESDSLAEIAPPISVKAGFDTRGNVTAETITAVADAALERLKALAVDVDGPCPVASMAFIGADGNGYFVGVTSEKLMAGIPMNRANNTFLPGHARPSGKKTALLNVNTSRCQAYLFAYRTALALSGGQPVELRGDKRVCATLIAGDYIQPTDEASTFVAGANMQKGAPPVTRLVWPDDANDCTYTVRIFKAA